jgi:hypothetical protein
MKTDKLFFLTGLLCGALLMWGHFNFYANDWSIIPHPTADRIVYAVEARSGAVKMIWRDNDLSTIRSIGFSDGAKLDAGEKVKIQMQENWSMD